MENILFKNNLTRKLKGSYTIEAALLTPFFVGIMILILYLGIALYDISSMQAIAVHSVQKAAAGQLEKTADRRKAAEECFQKQKKGTLFLVQGIHSKIDASNTKISMSVDGSFVFPAFNVVKKLIGNSKWKWKVKAEASITNPVDFIRKVKMVEYAVGTQKESK